MKNLKFNPEEGKIILEKMDGQHPIHLDFQLTKLLDILLQNENELVVKQELVEYVWQDNKLVGQEALPKNIWRLRKIINENQLQDLIQIKTIPKRGYKLIKSYSPVIENPENSAKKMLSKQSIFLMVAILVIVFIIAAIGSIGEDHIYY